MLKWSATSGFRQLAAVSRADRARPKWRCAPRSWPKTAHCGSCAPFPKSIATQVAVADAIDFYNNELPHMSLDWKTPAEAALCSGELKKKWVSHKENFLKKEIVWRKIRNFGATYRRGTSMLCGNCHTTIEQPSRNNRTAVTQLCDNCPNCSVLASFYCCPIKMSGSQFWVSSRKKAGKARWLSPWVCNFVLQTKKMQTHGQRYNKKNPP